MIRHFRFHDRGNHHAFVNAAKILICKMQYYARYANAKNAIRTVHIIWFKQSGGQFIWTLGRPQLRITPEVTPEVRLIQALVGEMTSRQLRKALRLKDDEHFRKAYLQVALDAGLIEMTIPDKPRSSRQRYRLTPKGIKRKPKTK